MFDSQIRYPTGVCIADVDNLHSYIYTCAGRYNFHNTPTCSGTGELFSIQPQACRSLGTGGFKFFCSGNPNPSLPTPVPTPPPPPPTPATTTTTTTAGYWMDFRYLSNTCSGDPVEFTFQRHNNFATCYANGVCSYVNGDLYGGMFIYIACYFYYLITLSLVKFQAVQHSSCFPSEPKYLAMWRTLNIQTQVVLAILWKEPCIITISFLFLFWFHNTIIIFDTAVAT